MLAKRLAVTIIVADLVASGNTVLRCHLQMQLDAVSLASPHRFGE